MEFRAEIALPTAFPGGLGERLALGLGVRVRRSRLDARLAADEDPAADAALSLRAAQLVSRRARTAVARDLESLLFSSRTGQSVGAAIQVHTEALDVARPAIEQLIVALRSSETVQPQGVALAMQLLTEAAGPLYAPTAIDALELAARESLRALAQ